MSRYVPSAQMKTKTPSVLGPHCQSLVEAGKLHHPLQMTALDPHHLKECVCVVSARRRGMIEEHVQISNIYCYIYVSPFIVTLVLPVFHMSLKLTCYCALNRVWSRPSYP